MQLRNLLLYLHLIQLSFKTYRIISVSQISCLFVYIFKKHINNCLIHILSSLKYVEFAFIDFFSPMLSFSLHDSNNFFTQKRDSVHVQMNRSSTYLNGNCPLLTPKKRISFDFTMYAFFLAGFEVLAE